MAGRSIDYIYRILDRYSPALAKMAQAGQKFDAGVSRIQAGLGKMQDKLQSAGGKLANLQTGLAAVGAGAFLKGALDESMQFQKSLNLTQAVTGSTAEQMEMMREKALEWGAQTQFSSVQVSAAMAELGKMGNKTNDILALMPGTMALAAAGEIQMSEAANYTMGILNQFGMELDQAGTVADILAAGASGAATSVGGLALAMNNAGLQSSMAGLSINDTTAALMAMASKNIEGAEAGTLFKNAMKALLVMTDKTREGFEDMGIDIDNFRDATTGQVTDFWGLIEAMKATGETGGRIMAETFDIRALQAFSAITGTTSDQLMEFRNVVDGSNGASQKMADTLLNGLAPMVQFQSLMQNMKVMVGTFVTTALLPMLTKFNEWFGNMQKNNPELLKLITYILMGITALGAILVPMGLVLSSVGSLIGVVKAVIGFTKLWTAAQTIFNAVMAANPISLVVLAVAALAAGAIAVYKNWEPIKAFFVDLWEKLKPIIDGITGFFGGVGGKVKEFFTGGGEGAAATSPYSARYEGAPIPGTQGVGANATASVSVYTERGMNVTPFVKQGNLGYNMTDSYSRGM